MKPKPNGTSPLDCVVTAAERDPSGATVKTSIAFASRSVTTTWLPSGLTPIVDAPLAAVPRFAVATGDDAGTPLSSRANSAMALLAAFSANRRRPETATDTGCEPPDGTVASFTRSPPATAKVVIELLPAFTT